MSPIIECGACLKRFDASTHGTGASSNGRSNNARSASRGRSRGGIREDLSAVSMTEEEQLELALAISLDDAQVQTTARSASRSRGRPRPPSPSPSTVSQATDRAAFWKCPNCVCSNAPHVARCVCGWERQTWMRAPPRPHATSQTGRDRGNPPQATVACPQCTLINAIGNSHCDACGGPLKRAASPGLARAGGPGAQSMRHTPRVVAPQSVDEAITQRADTVSVEEKQHAELADARALLRHIEATCGDQRVAFVDDSFRPGPAALYTNGRTWSSQDVAERRGRPAVTKWLRPAEVARSGSAFDVYNQPWCVFRGDPQPGDVRQGALGDCWLLSAIAVLAERPALLTHLLPAGKALSPTGAYMVRLCVDGTWNTILVDDLLPCFANGTLAFSQAHRRQLYVPLIEKAMAKYFGSYEAIEAGTVGEALAALTGFPVEQICLQPQSKEGDEAFDVDMVWARLLSFKEAGFLAGASCSPDNERHAQAQGLQTMHAYSVLDVRVESGHRLVKMRNPWGKESWRGDWSHGSNRWTPELRRRLRPDAAEGGVFWISWEDCIRFFREIDVCKVRPQEHGWMEARLFAPLPPLRPSEALVCFDMEVMAPTEVEVMLSQYNSRNSQADSTDLWVGVFRKGPTGELGDLCATCERRVTISVCCNAMLEAGAYVIVPAAPGHTGRAASSASTVDNPPVLAVFSGKPVVVRARRATEALVREAVVALVKAKGKRRAVFEGDDMVVHHLNDRAGSLVYAENRSRFFRFVLSVDAEESFNLISSRSALTLEDVLLPNQGQLVLALTQSERTSGYQSSFRFRFRADRSREAHDPPVPLKDGFHSPIDIRPRGRR